LVKKLKTGKYKIINENEKMRFFRISIYYNLLK
jgi:hypothetical protein